MYNNSLWYKKQDEDTKQRLAQIFHQKEILRQAVNKRTAEKAPQRDEKKNSAEKPVVVRKLF